MKGIGKVGCSSQPRPTILFKQLQTGFAVFALVYLNSRRGQNRSRCFHFRSSHLTRLTSKSCEGGSRLKGWFVSTDDEASEQAILLPAA